MKLYSSGGKIYKFFPKVDIILEPYNIQIMSVERYLNVPVAVGIGAACDLPTLTYEVGSHLASQTECHGFNPLPEDILSDFDLKISKREGVRASGLKRDFGITRADIMIYFASFVDVHRLPEVDKLLKFEPESVKLIENVEQLAKNGSPLSLSEQLEVALDETDNDITKAVLALAIGTRAMARGVDNRLISSTQIDKDRMENWKDCVKAFGNADELEDSAGDTYHFWHGVLTGMSRQEAVDPAPICRAKQSLCDFIYNRTALATEFFRHRVYGKNGNTHELVDRLGYEVGRAFMGIYGGNSEGS
ncbi:hypothetical protein A2714_04885 [Candidatus Woesebacteria bacterium RIFCSPHIGHO2_01_FULL_38_9]|uniref:Uncharacterized protein n=2 Tax=Candidatus Woeseibacteriota TaxID=1752722 RepID=A0A1F7Y1T9_9BACT|nr:MAG: hypothetical protein A2714_04885 [Candidatus Woesebacteria bacterium RIFCSPHIGHO2_01_FULL_38_9]OGM58812.1 MAG: hypothetical protein A3A75_00275 [Candidatus Woesebacteria bacterium RIFCSPLOWO2_01_FULL_39_10]